jgi:transglutaminase-like putative cysteine protease/tetratricopeptide (TPR) repeat protein
MPEAQCAAPRFSKAPGTTPVPADSPSSPAEVPAIPALGFRCCRPTRLALLALLLCAAAVARPRAALKSHAPVQSSNGAASSHHRTTARQRSARRHSVHAVRKSTSAAAAAADDARQFAAAAAAFEKDDSLGAQRIREQQKAFAAATTTAGRAAAVYRLMEWADLLHNPASAMAVLHALAGEAGTQPLVRAEIEHFIAEIRLRSGDPGAAGRTWDRLGILKHWRAVGPFDNTGASSFQAAAGPEQGSVLDLAASYTGKQRTVGWKQLPFGPGAGTVTLPLYFTPARSAAVYVVTWVNSPAARTLALRFTDDGSTRAWVNRQLLFDEEGVHRAEGFDMHAVPVRLLAGWNEVLFKVGTGEQNRWVFAARFTTVAGEPVVLGSSDTPPPQADAPVALRGASSRRSNRRRPARRASNVVTIWRERAVPASVPAELKSVKVADVLDDARSQAATPAGARQYAFLLSKIGAFDVGENADIAAWEAALAQAPKDILTLLDFAENDRDASRSYRNLEEVLRLDPGNTEALIRRGFIELGRNEFWPARDDFEVAIKAEGGAAASGGGAMADPRPFAGLAQVFAGYGLPAEVERIAGRLEQAGFAQSDAVAGPLTASFARLDDPVPALHWAKLAVAADRGQWSFYLTLSNIQKQAGDFAGALTTLKSALDILPDMPLLQELEARTLAGMGRGPEALAMIHLAESLDADNPTLRVADGEIESLLKHQAPALAEWEAALRLNPQDNELRDRLLLAHAGGAESSFDLPYRTDAVQAIAAFKRNPAPRKTGGPLLVLVDTAVDRIFPSGNVGHFVQQIYRVNNNAGADELAVFPVTYDPAVENVHFISARVIHPDGSITDAPEAEDATVSDAVGYETFYDVRNKYVRMPNIQPGDFVEIAYTVIPTTLESLYGDYYGQVQPFGGDSPKLQQQFVVIVPANKPLYYHPVRFQGQFTVTTTAPGNAEKRAAAAVTASAQSAGGAGVSATAPVADRVYRWTMNDVPVAYSEPNAPPMIESVPYIEVSSFKDWPDFAAWYTGLIRDTFVMNDDLRQTTDRLVQGLTTDEAKADAIYSYVIRNTRYVALEFGIHGYRPYPVTQVFRRRFGDCKDKASLLVAMLEHAGIRADLVLVRTRDRGLVDPAIPSVADFDHAIVYVPSLDRYLDGTAEYNGARELPGGDQRAMVLRIPVNADLPGAADDPPPSLDAVKPVVTAELPAAQNSWTRTLTGSIDSRGNLAFDQNMIVSGEQAPLFRHAMELPDRRAGLLQNMLRQSLPGITVTSVDAQNQNQYDLPLQVNFSGSVPHFATELSDTSLLVPRALISVNWVPRFAPLATRVYPVLLDPPSLVRETLSLTLPPGFHAVLPREFDLDSKFAHVSSSVAIQNGVLVIRDLTETRTSEIPVADYQAFRQFWESVDAAMQRSVRVVPN